LQSVLKKSKNIFIVNTLSYKTISANKQTVTKEWVVLDAENQILGRFASQAAKILRGKHKTNFTPHADTGDYVIIINAEKIRLTGNKEDSKTYIHHTGYPGGQRVVPIAKIRKNHPERIVEKAIKGMLPKNRLGRAIFKNLHVYTGSSHPHEAQTPKTIDLNKIKL